MGLLKNNTLVMGIVAVALLVLGWYFFLGSSGGSAPLTQGGASPVSQNLLVMLTNLKTVQLNGAIFSDPAFLSLSDFDVTIPPQPAGRSNPFAPLAPGASGAGSGAVLLPTTR